MLQRPARPSRFERHFMLDLDGTVCQTLDLTERARHATTSNRSSVRIEMANLGAHRDASAKTLAQWYAKEPAGRTHITKGLDLSPWDGWPARFPAANDRLPAVEFALRAPATDRAEAFSLSEIAAWRISECPRETACAASRYC